jgi:hypothetical protein
LRNLAPADRCFIQLFKGFQPSKVVQDFFHPLYHHSFLQDVGLLKPLSQFHPVPPRAFPEAAAEILARRPNWAPTGERYVANDWLPSGKHFANWIMTAFL